LREVVLDASVVLKWIRSENERHLEPALELRRGFEGGELHVLAPPLLWLEVVNVAARGWHWDEGKLTELASTLPELGFEIVEPELESVAHWCSEGLTSYDAAYVTVAEGAGVNLVTDDMQIVAAAPEIALALSD